MSNQEQLDFLSKCRKALVESSFRRMVFSSGEKGTNKFLARFELVEGGKNRFVRYSDNRGTEENQEKLDIETLMEKISAAPFTPFKSATLSTESTDLHYAENRKGTPRLYNSKPSFKGKIQSHNKAKNYVLDKSRPFLKGLGVTSGSGEVLKKHYGKFRQIANFVEIIDREIGTFVTQAQTPVSLLDLGCGKGYLTFATFDYVQTRSSVQPKAVGIDIKTNVIDLCNSLATDLDFDGLEFRNARIQPTKPEDVDILIALHACDTATDDALALGVRSHMEFFFCAPCCQAEIAAQIEPAHTGFDLINEFPLMKRRQADIVTDVCRALLLTALGYEVKFLEFTALEHTSKNVMLVGKKSEKVDRKKALENFKELKRDSGFKRHSLEEHLKDLLYPS